MQEGPNLRAGLDIKNNRSTKVSLVRYPKYAALNHLRKRLLCVEMRYLVFQVFVHNKRKRRSKYDKSCVNVKLWALNAQLVFWVLIGSL